jgi:hypothetical protein
MISVDHDQRNRHRVEQITIRRSGPFELSLRFPKCFALYLELDQLHFDLVA